MTSLTQGSRALRLLAVAALLVLALVISLQFLSALVLLALTAVSIWQFRRLRSYAWTLAIAVLVLVSLATLIIGLPGLIAGGAVAVSAVVVLIRSKQRSGLARMPAAAFWGAVGILGLPLLTLALGTLVNRSAAISWVMMGDGFEWVRYLGDLRTLGPFEVVTSGLFPRLTMSTELLARTVIVPGSGTAGLIADVQANVAWVVLALAAAAADLLRRAAGRSCGRVALVQGVAVSLVMCSTLVIGLVAANGFLSVAPTVALYVLGLLAVTHVVRDGDRVAVWVAVIAAAALVTSWQPVALVVAGLLIGALSRRALARHALGRWWPVLAGLAVIGLVIGSVLVTVRSLTSAGQGHFPAMPLAALLVAVAAALAVSVGTKVRILSQVIAIGFIAGSLAAVICFQNGGVWGLLASVHTTGITPYYYVEKFIWIAAIPAVLLLICVLVSAASVRRIGLRTSAIAWALVLGASFTAAQVPNAPWLPLGSRSDVLELGDLVLDPALTESPRVFVGFQAPHVDAVLNAWDGLLWDRYLSSDPVGSGAGAARKEAIWQGIQGGNLVGAACAAAASATGPITIITAQPTLEADTAKSCADALGPVTFEVRADRGV